MQSSSDQIEINPLRNWAWAALLQVLLLLAPRPAAGATPAYWWDTNGSDSGAGYPLDGDWDNTTLNWTDDSGGNSATFAYPGRANVVFAATGGDDWWNPGEYTVTIHGTARVSDIQFEDGYCTLTASSPDHLDTDAGTIGVLNSGQIASVYCNITNAAGTTNGLTKYAPGILVLGGTNTYQGWTTIEGGVLKLAGPQVLPNTSPLVLANGGTGGYVKTPATLDTGGFSQTLGPLSLVGGNTNVVRAIDFEKGSGTLAFADSHLQNWNGIPLTLLNYSNRVSSLRFGTSSAGLTAAQLDLIQFRYTASGFPLFVPAAITSNGFVVPTSPAILSATTSGSTNRVITWKAVSGRKYVLHYKDNLNGPTWSDDGLAVTASSSTASQTNSVGSAAHRFYWVEPLPYEPPN